MHNRCQDITMEDNIESKEGRVVILFQDAFCRPI